MPPQAIPHSSSSSRREDKETSSSEEDFTLRDRDDEETISRKKAGLFKRSLADEEANGTGFFAAPPALDVEDREFYGTDNNYVVYDYNKSTWVSESDTAQNLRVALAGYLCKCIRATDIRHISQRSVECKEHFAYLYDSIKDCSSGNRDVNAVAAFGKLSNLLLRQDTKVHWSLIWSNMIDENKKFQET